MTVFYFKEPSPHETKWASTHQQEMKLLNQFFEMGGVHHKLSDINEIGFRKFDTSNTLFYVKHNDHLILRLSNQEINVTSYKDGQWRLEPRFIELTQNAEFCSQYQQESQQLQADLSSKTEKAHLPFFSHLSHLNKKINNAVALATRHSIQAKTPLESGLKPGLKPVIK